MQETNNSQSLITKKREQYRVDIRRKHHQNYFNKRRKQLVQQNQNNIADILPRIKQLFPYLSIQNMDQDQFVERLEDILLGLRRINCREYIRMQVSEFLVGVAMVIIQISNDKEDITKHQHIAVRVRTILHDALAQSDINLVQFIDGITPILEYPFFFELYYNILLTHNLPGELKTSIVLKLLTMLSKFPNLYMSQHFLAIEIMYISAKVQPKPNQYTYQSILETLNSVYSLLVLDKMDYDDDSKKQKENSNLYCIFIEALSSQTCCRKFITSEHLIEKLLNDIKSTNMSTSDAWFVIGKLMTSDQITIQLLQKHPVIQILANHALDTFAHGASQDYQVIRYILYTISNMVCIINGLRLFIDKQWDEKIFLIGIKYSSNAHIKNQCIFVFLNVIQTLLCEVEGFEKILVNVLKKGGYEFLIEALKSDSKTMLITTLECIGKLLELELSFSFQFIHDNTLKARVSQIFGQTQEVDLLTVSERILNRLERHQEEGQQ